MKPTGQQIIDSKFFKQDKYFNAANPSSGYSFYPLFYEATASEIDKKWKKIVIQ